MNGVLRIIEAIGAVGAVAYLVVNLAAMGKRWWTMRKLIPLVIVILPTLAQAATYTSEACNGSDDQTKINTAIGFASDGDTVQIPAGTCTFTSSVTWTNKAITVQGAGVGSTSITANSVPAFDVTVTTQAGFRITAMTLNANALSSTGAIEIDGTGMSSEIASRFRVDHITFNIDNGTGPRGMFVYGAVYGLIDHATFDYNGGDTVNGISVQANLTADTSFGGSTQVGSYACDNFALDLGGDTAVYVEDSTFTHAWGTGNSGGINDLQNCGRMVFRYNTVTGPWHLQTHSTRGVYRGGIRWEYYNNSFDGNDDGAYTGPMVARGGTGVIFNNTFTGFSLCWWCSGGQALLLDFQRVPNTSCTVSDAPLNTVNGSNAADGQIESNGWPALDQPGWTGDLGAQTNTPIYIWNNGDEPGCATGGTCAGDWNNIYLNCEGEGNVGAKMEDYVKTTAHSNGAKDYCIGTTTMPSSCGTHTNTYTAYTYPHPLQGAGSSGGSFPFLFRAWPWIEVASALGAAYHWRGAIAGVLIFVLGCGVTGASMIAQTTHRTVQIVKQVSYHTAQKAAVAYLTLTQKDTDA